MQDNVPVDQLIQRRLNYSVDLAFDNSFRILEELGITLYENQEEIVTAILDNSINRILIAQARAAGKTFGVEIGLLYLCVDNPNLRVGVAGPKLDQATRLLKELQGVLKGSRYRDAVDWNNTSAAKIHFTNGSYIIGISGSPTAEVEGHHFDVLVVDEAHRVSSFSFENKLLPMLGGSDLQKVIKLGVTMFKGHFWRSARPGSPYLKLIRDWTRCPYLLRGGSVVANGIEYSRFVLDQMPLAMKQKMFPDRPDLHYEGELTQIDFMTQYMMEWAENLNTFFTDKDQEMILGEHDIEDTAKHHGAEYYFGLDTQKGTLLEESTELDFTSLSIWKKLSTGIKQKVACFEWQQDPLNQRDEIIEIITRVFPCTFGLVDYSNNGVMMLSEFKEAGIMADGVIFNAKEKNTGLNYKNAMYNHFLMELRHGRAKYPSKEVIESDVLLTKHYNEWTMLERITKLGINDAIRAPSGEHDDGPDSDVLAVFASDKIQLFGGTGRLRRSKPVNLPKPVIGIASISNPMSRRNLTQGL